MRKRITALLLAVLLLTAGSQALAATTRATRTTGGTAHWAQPAIDALTEEGILDDEVLPEENITRAQWLELLLRAVGRQAEDGDYTALSRELGILHDYRKNPRQINRYLMSATLIAAAETCLEEEPVESGWAEANLADYDEMTGQQQYAVGQAGGKGLIGGYPDGSFNGDGGLTWAEAATVILRLTDEGQRLNNGGPEFSGSLTVNDITVEMGMTEDDVLDLLGEPDDILRATRSTYTWVYGAGGDRDFLTVGFTPGGDVYFAVTVGTDFYCTTGSGTGYALYADSLHEDSEEGDVVYAGAVEVSLTLLEEQGLLTWAEEDLDEEAAFAEYAATMDDYAKMTFYFLNAYRAFNGLAPLTWDTGLQEAATWKAEDMVQEGYFSSRTPDGETAGQIAAEFGVTGTVREIIACRDVSAIATAVRWISNESARALILDETLTRAAVGRAYPQDDPANHYSSMMFS